MNDCGVPYRYVIPQYQRQILRHMAYNPILNVAAFSNDDWSKIAPKHRIEPNT
ncbi:hypothetical protein D3C75_1381070 [compost metagenome]